MLDPEKPFVVKVPEGATEIDLGPILRPIIFRLLKAGGRPRGSKDIDPYLIEADEQLAYRYVVEKITRPMVIDYIKGNGWVSEDEREYCFRRDWDMKRNSWDRSGPRVWTTSDDRWSIRDIDEAIKVLVQEERQGATMLSIARKILNSSNILDRIVGELRS